jgi:hypothetical protein
MKSLLLATLILIALPIRGQILPDCEWGAYCDVANHCASGGSQGVGCDDSSGHCAQCYRGFTDGGQWLGVRMDRKTGVAVVMSTGGLPDVKAGDQLRAAGSATAKRLTNMRSGSWLTRYSKAHPARSLRLRLFRPSTGSWLVVTWKSKD